MKSTPDMQCGINAGRRDDCEAPSVPDAPFPICERHLIQITRFSFTLGRDTLNGETGSVEGMWHRHLKNMKEKLSVVYYVDVGDGIVKIGRTSNLRTRMQDLYRRPEHLMAVEVGGADKERERHEQFAHLRVDRSERFRLDDELREHIADRRKRRPHHYKGTVASHDRIGNKDDRERFDEAIRSVMQ